MVLAILLFMSDQGLIMAVEALVPEFAIATLAAGVVITVVYALASASVLTTLYGILTEKHQICGLLTPCHP